MNSQVAQLYRIDIEEGKAGLFYATSPDLTGLLVGCPTLDELYDAVPKAIAELRKAADGTDVIVIRSVRKFEPRTHFWTAFPAAEIKRLFEEGASVQ